MKKEKLKKALQIVLIAVIAVAVYAVIVPEEKDGTRAEARVSQGLTPSNGAIPN